MGKIVSGLKSLPTIFVLAAAAIGALTLYIHQREQAAIARAQWEARVDSLAAAREVDSIAAAIRDSARQDSIAHFQAVIRWQRHSADSMQRQADSSAVHGAAAAKTLRLYLAQDTLGTRLLDTLEAAHAAETGALRSSVVSLRTAMAYADSVHGVDAARIADRDRQIGMLRGQIVTLTDAYDKLAHRGLVDRVLASPWSHLASAAIGYMAG